MIVRLHHAQITVPRGREEEARAFYCGFLGLPEVPKPSALKARGGLWLQVGDRQVHIGTEDGVDHQKTKAHLAYETPDLDGWRTRLRSRGIGMLEGVSIPGWDRIEFRDPFGNRVELIQRLTGSGPEGADLVRTVEELAANAWPASVQQFVDGWRLRFHAGVTRRANSVLALEDSGILPLDQKLEMVEDFYCRANAPARFQMNPLSQPAGLDEVLEQRGYRLTDRTQVQVAAVADVPEPVEVENGPVVQHRDTLFREWYDAYLLCERTSDEAARARRALIERIAPRTAFFWADFAPNSIERGHVPPGVGLGVLERGWLGIFCMATRQDFRRQGVATAVLQGMVQWGREQGAQNVYLQVSEENTPALALYESLGFRTAYPYWYRELPLQAPEP